MPELGNYLTFVAAAAALIVIPGPAVLYIIARSINQGRFAGLVSVLGIALGSLVHVVTAAVGLSAILMSSAVAFAIVKYLGAAYLIFLGIRTLWSGHAVADDGAIPVERKSLQRVFWQGVVVNILNPKTALFFFAFLPQFANPAQGALGVQIVLLGMTFTTIAVVSDSVYAFLAGTAGQWLKRNRVFLTGQRYVSGGIYVLLGMATAVSGSSSE